MCVCVYIYIYTHTYRAYIYTHTHTHIQGDQKVSVHLMIIIQKAGAQRLFDHPVYDVTLCVCVCVYIYIYINIQDDQKFCAPDDYSTESRCTETF